jgi:hypothetical protein
MSDEGPTIHSCLHGFDRQFDRHGAERRASPASPDRRFRMRAEKGLGSKYQSLTVVPQSMMNDKIDWTRELRDVFLAQQQDVLNAVQRLCQRADTVSYLKSTAQQKITKTTLPATAPAPSNFIRAPTIVCGF